MMKFEKCVVCGEADFEVLKSVEWQITGQGTFKLNFSICRTCGQVAQNPFPTMEQVETFYSENINYHLPNFVAELPEEPFSTRLRIRDALRRFKPEKGKVLEIGCGSGENLFYLQKDGWDSYGCEPSPHCSEKAIERLGKEKVSVGFSHDIDIPEVSYDAVFISHVIEHVRDPKGIMRQAMNAAKDDGVIIFEVPCTRQPHRLMPGWLSLEHILYFSAGTISRLAEECGLEIVETILDDEYHLYPAVCIICKKASAKVVHNHFNEYELNKHIVNEFLKADKAHWDGVAKKLEGISEAYIYAAGNHTSQLLFETGFADKANIINIVDSSPIKEGMSLGKHKVISRQRFQEQYKGEKVVVVSYFSEAEIAKSLAELGVKEENIVRLYTG
ncbi:class I SAM-dependent methyltransferase [Kordiimonas laminariae]|uniref:class I SAM-dependent methyltransferase n=1 Tax=Kordiimonas laminariae TaxID=2917717 RepID=UPI001FF14013|nr:class I SAM-dependent methyltransferase [Kordiimonas laminariae]MCK0069626.1 class I SAM-dependent methyltransferase [Kordiimonas laminariae]